MLSGERETQLSGAGARLEAGSQAPGPGTEAPATHPLL